MCVCVHIFIDRAARLNQCPIALNPQYATAPHIRPRYPTPFSTHSARSVAYAQRASPQALPNAAAASAGPHVLQQTQLQQQYAD